MVYLVLGPSGSGKTKYLIEEANREKAGGNGNIVFIDADDSHIFTLDYSVRLINAAKYKVNNVDTLTGFVSGIASRDYDIEKIYIDGIYDIVDLSGDSLVQLIDKFNWLGDEYNIDIYMGLNQDKADLPEGLKVELKELN